MKFAFNIEKAIAATGFLIEISEGKIDVFQLLKTLYLADRTAIAMLGAPIVGDDYVSLPKGPVLSTTYDCLKGNARVEFQKPWSTNFTDRVGHAIRTKKPVSTERLSQWEKKALKKALKTISSVPKGNLSAWSHKVFPEWKDRGTSSSPIDLVEMLRAQNKTDQEILVIQDEAESAYCLSQLLTG